MNQDLTEHFLDSQKLEKQNQRNVPPSPFYLVLTEWKDDEEMLHLTSCQAVFFLPSSDSLDKCPLKGCNSPKKGKGKLF